MEGEIFKLTLYLIQTLRSLLAPLIIILSYPLSAKLRRRLEFEYRNFETDYDPRREAAFVAFEVSSEGELEQVRPLIDHLLLKGHIVEVLYASPSLESKMIRLSNSKKAFRSFRLPVLSYGLTTNTFLLSQNIKSFITAPRLVLCRYDFYPELLLYGLKNEVQFSLASATLKNKEKLGWFLKQVFKSFDSILCTGHKDESLFKELISREAKLGIYEFRVVQILERIKERQAPLERLGKITDWIGEVCKDKRIIFGSIWLRETAVFNDDEFCQSIKTGELRVVLLPHQYHPKILNSIKSIKTYLYKDGDSVEDLLSNMKKDPGVLLLDVHGILCEMYSLFGHSFIGGGHGRSVHSVLEPYFSGCHIYCGPKVHRSTEVDFINSHSQEDLSIVNELEDFFRVFKQIGKSSGLEARHKLGEDLYSEFDNKVNLLLGKH